MQNHFSGIDCITEGWSLVKGSKLTFGCLLLLILGCKILAFIPLLGVAFFIIEMILGFGLIYFGVLRAEGKNIEFNMLRDVFSLKILVYVIGWYILIFLFTIPFVAPAILFAYLRVPHVVEEASQILNVPNIIFLLAYLAWISYGAYLYVRIWFAYPAIVMQKLTPWEAIKKSYYATKSKVASLSLMIFLQIIFILLGFATLGIGLIWAVPLAFISTGVAYKKLLNT